MLVVRSRRSADAAPDCEDAVVVFVGRRTGSRLAGLPRIVMLGAQIVGVELRLVMVVRDRRRASSMGGGVACGP